MYRVPRHQANSESPTRNRYYQSTVSCCSWMHVQRSRWRLIPFQCLFLAWMRKLPIGHHTTHTRISPTTTIAVGICSLLLLLYGSWTNLVNTLMLGLPDPSANTTVSFQRGKSNYSMKFHRASSLTHSPGFRLPSIGGPLLLLLLLSLDYIASNQ